MTLKLLLLLTLWFQTPEISVMECTADTSIPGRHGDETTFKLEVSSTVLLTFRMGAVEGWKIGKALMLVHLAEGSQAGQVRIAPILGKWKERSDEEPALGEFQVVQEQSKPGGWVAIAIPPSFLEKGAKGIALRGTGQRIHSRESLQFSPYLALQRKK